MRLKATRFLFCDDSSILTMCVRAVLVRQPALEFLGHAQNGRAALRLAAAFQPDVVLVEATAPGLKGLELTRRLQTRLPSQRVLAYSVEAPAQLVNDMLDAGAFGYLLKCSPVRVWLQAIRAVVAGRRYLGPGLRGTVPLPNH